MFEVKPSTFYDDLKRLEIVIDKYANLRKKVIELFEESYGSAGQRSLVNLLRLDGMDGTRYLVR